jgi:hypothetical protein
MKKYFIMMAIGASFELHSQPEYFEVKTNADEDTTILVSPLSTIRLIDTAPGGTRIIDGITVYWS